MAKTLIVIGERDRKLLLTHFRFYAELESGKRAPSTPAERHFVEVCRGSAAPATEHEQAYMSFKRLVAKSRLLPEELLRRQFHYSPADMKDEPAEVGPATVSETEYRPVDVDRWSSKRRWVRRYNW